MIEPLAWSSKKTETQPLELVVDLRARSPTTISPCTSRAVRQLNVEIQQCAPQRHRRHPGGQQRDHAHRRPRGRGRPTPRPAWRGPGGVELVGDEVDAQPRQAQGHDAARQQEGMQAEHLQTPAPVGPAQREHAPDEPPITHVVGTGRRDGHVHNEKEARAKSPRIIYWLASRLARAAFGVRRRTAALQIFSSRAWRVTRFSLRSRPWKLIRACKRPSTK